MKRYKKFFTAAALVLSLVFPVSAIAADTTTTQDVPIGTSNVIEMIGTIEPTIMSVTMPTFVPFNMSNSLAGQNKVLSPRITMKNNSTVPVKINVTYARVDMKELNGAQWSDTGTVNDYQISIGLKEEETQGQQPTDLKGAKWLQMNKSQNSNVLILNSNDSGAIYVVGTLGAKVAENGTFSVIPSFVVSKTSDI